MKRRVWLTVSVGTFNLFKRMRKRSEAKTNGEFLAELLELYAWFVNKQKNGYSIEVHDERGVTEIDL